MHHFCCLSTVAFLVVVPAVICQLVEVAKDSGSPDYFDRTCDSHECFLNLLKAYDNCQLSVNKNKCLGDNCKFIGNANMRMCVNSKELSKQTTEEILRRIKESSVNIESQDLCVFDDDGNVYDTFCTTFGGNQCNSISKKCVMNSEQYKQSDQIVTNLRRDTFELPYDYTNNLLIVVDGMFIY